MTKKKVMIFKKSHESWLKPWSWPNENVMAKKKVANKEKTSWSDTWIFLKASPNVPICLIFFQRIKHKPSKTFFNGLEYTGHGQKEKCPWAIPRNQIWWLSTVQNSRSKRAKKFLKTPNYENFLKTRLLWVKENPDHDPKKRS